MPMLISAVVGTIVGLLVAHFLATWILVLWTLFVVYIFWDIFHKLCSRLGICEKDFSSLDTLWVFFSK